jgi:hypothetical protein
MNKELEQKFYDRWPEWFRGRHEGMRNNLMYFGFDHDDGWFDLEWRLCEDLEKLVGADYKLMQVKEKFGTLRWYDDFGTEETRKRIRQAENESAITCELCGKLGRLRGHSWVRTLCDVCESK